MTDEHRRSDDGGTARDAGGLTEADRDAVVAALDAHRDAGRLDDVGFEDRSIRARQAWTRADLDLLFIDLPEPHPVPGAPAWGSVVSASAVSQSDSPVPQSDSPVPQSVSPVPEGVSPVPQSVSAVPLSASPVPARRRLVSPQVAQTVIALSPFAAFGLWYVSSEWIWFLLIPVTAIILGNAAGEKDAKPTP